MNQPKRKPGRPKKAICQEYKSVSFKKELWAEMFRQAQALGTTVGKIAENRVLNGKVNPDQLLKDDENRSTANEDGFDL